MPQKITFFEDVAIGYCRGYLHSYTSVFVTIRQLEFSMTFFFEDWSHETLYLGYK